MKKLSNRIAMVAMSLTLTIATPTAAFAGVNAVPSQPVDLTYAAEKALPSVVHIRFLQNSKVKQMYYEKQIGTDFL